MDDLDAILADLETSVTPRNIYEDRWETHTTTEHATVPASGSRVSTLDRSRHSHSPDPPPLPPLPAQEVLDGFQNSQEFFRAKSPGQPIYSSTITISKSVYNTNGDQDQPQRSQSISPGPSRIDPGSLSTDGSYRFQSRSTGARQVSSPTSKPVQLSNNLSELDSLLDDLNSPKFYAEVDKTNHSTLENHRVSPQQSGTLKSQPGSRSGTLQREQPIPKLIVPPSLQNANYGNYDDVDTCRGSSIQRSFVQDQSFPTVVSQSTSSSQYYNVQPNVVQTNVQQPPIQQLRPDQRGSQYRGSSQSPVFRQEEFYLQQQFPPPQQQFHQQQIQQQQFHQQQQQPNPIESIQQHPSQGQVMVPQQGQGQGPMFHQPQGQGLVSQHTTIQQYTEERIVKHPTSQSTMSLPPQQHFMRETVSHEGISPPTQIQQQQSLNQMSQQQQQQQQSLNQMSMQQGMMEPVQQQFVTRTMTQYSQQGNNGGPHARTTSASKDLEELMASFSEFDVKKGQVVGEPQYAQPVKTRLPSTGLDVPDSGGYRSSQEQMTSSYMSSSQNAQGQYDGASPGITSPSPHEMVIQPSPSTVGHPVPIVVAQDQSSSKMVVTQGMHGVQGSRSGQAGDGQMEVMFGQFGNDMNQQGILTLPKGDCAACNKSVVGQVLMALGKIWHPEHFVCAHCHQELGTNIFFERDGHPYCESDYQILFSPKCALCGGPILEKCITALNKTWHPEHFFCAECQRPFGEEGFHERNGMPFCRDDYFRMFAPKCGGCGDAILSNYVTALQRQWHPECFVCRECHAPFESGSFYDHNGLPYCEQHFHAQRGSLCAACRQPIMGRCIAAMYRKFHPEHFVCVFCLQPLNKGTFKEQNDKPYCHQCFEKLFG